MKFQRPFRISARLHNGIFSSEMKPKGITVLETNCFEQHIVRPRLQSKVFLPVLNVSSRRRDEEPAVMAASRLHPTSLANMSVDQIDKTLCTNKDRKMRMQFFPWNYEARNTHGSNLEISTSAAQISNTTVGH